MHKTKLERQADEFLKKHGQDHLIWRDQSTVQDEEQFSSEAGNITTAQENGRESFYRRGYKESAE